MAHLTVVKAVEARLKAGFNACPVFVENEVGGTPDQAGAWALVDFPWCRSNWITEDEFEEEGGFRVILALPILQGTHQGREWLDQIATLFRGQRFAGVQCFAPQTAASDDTNDRGAYFRLVLTVPYTFIIEG